MKQTIKARTQLTVLVSLASGILGACGGSGSSSTPPPPPPPPPPPSAFGPNFSEIQANVFATTCATSGCHSGAGAPQGLRLDASNSYGLLVGVASMEVPMLLRVEAGDPANSYLVQKLEGRASVGAQMPFGGTPLPQSTIDIIRQWITDGAIDDRALATGPIRVTSLSPLPGTTLASAPDSVIAIFDRELDANTVGATTFLLAASGGDGTFGDGNETQIVAAGITTPAMAPTSATFDLSGANLADDDYQVSLLGAGASVIQDLNANALDGEFSGTFPSGDGTQGGDFVATFTVQTPVATGLTLDDIQAAVFSPTCSNSTCHSGPSGPTLPSGMDLTSADATFANIVGTASVQQPMLFRVEPFDPDNSYLIRKLEGTAGNTQMPLGGTPLDQTVIDDIRQWISDGAPR